MCVCACGVVWVGACGVQVIAEAVSKGAKVVNPRGNQFDRTFVAPSVVFPVTRDMELYWKVAPAPPDTVHPLSARRAVRSGR